MRPRLILAVLALLAWAGAPAAWALGSWVDIRVIDRASGRALPVYRHAGRHYVAGQPGTRYAIAVRNVRGDRLLAVMSVDGVNVLSGETASWDQAGYVLAPWQRYEVTGWRKSLEEVAAFEFTSLGEAYATRTGRPGHVGVIGVAVFRERPEAVAAPAAKGSASADEASSALRERSAPAAAERLGTGHGQRERSNVAQTSFERAQQQPDEVLTLYYDSRENLLAQGVIPTPRSWPRPQPQPFPDSPPVGFVPDPPRRP